MFIGVRKRSAGIRATIYLLPDAGDIELLDSDPGKARGQQYDVVLNGAETAGEALGSTTGACRRRSLS